MKNISVEIEGTTPMLMHAMGEATLLQLSRQSKKITDIPKPKEEAEGGAYRMQDGMLYVPARAVKAALIRASSFYKMGKKSMRPYIAGCLRVEPYEISLGTDKYEIDLRPVVIGRGNKILRARPLLRTWKIAFTLVYDDAVFRNTEQLKDVLEEAGKRCGLLDNRPDKGGENGTFKVTKFVAEY